MIPQFYRSVAPGIAVQQNAGLAAAANARLGGTIAQLGGALVNYAEAKAERSDILAYSRAWRSLDDWRVKYLQELATRRKDLAATQLDPESGANTTGYELELKNFPDALQAEYERLGEGLSTPARQRLELRFNENAPQWSGQAAHILTTLETEDITSEILELAGQDRASEAAELLDQYQDRFSAGDRQRIETAIAKAQQQGILDAAQRYLQGLAQSSGWEAAETALNDPEFQKAFGLDLAAAGQIKTDLDKFVSDAKALAEGRDRAAKEKADDEVLAEAWEGKLDLATLPQKVRDNEVDATVAGQAREIMLKRLENRTTDDLAVLEEAYDWLRRVREDPSKRREASIYVRHHAGSLPQSGQDLIKQIQLAGTAADPGSRVGVKVVDRLLDEDYDLGVFGEVGTPEAQRVYLDAKQQWARWSNDHPDATDAEISAKKEAMIQALVKPGFWKRVGSLLSRVGSTTEWGGLDQLNESRRAASTAAVAPAPPVYQGVDSAIEPATVEEFYETVKSLEGQPEAQKQYYDKWARKWQ